MSPERQNVETHVNTVCPLTVVNCDFHYAGCEVQLVRKDMPTHLAESLAAHISLLTTQTQTLVIKGAESLLPHLSLLALHNQQLTQLTIQQKESLEELRKENNSLKTNVNKDVSQEIAELRRQLKDTQNESQRKIQELEREKQVQATVNAELKKCSEANKREIVALKQKVYDNVDQEMAELRRQQAEDIFLVNWDPAQTHSNM